jgi:hypothetical protein
MTLKPFTVIVTRDTTESAVLTVDAKNIRDARDQAMRMVLEDTNQIDWEQDYTPNASAHPYITHVQED